MTLKMFAGQLAIRMTVVAAVLTTAGVTSYQATHWEPRIGNSPPTQVATH
jgi:hypothetical protein